MMNSEKNREIILNSLKGYSPQSECSLKSELISTAVDDISALFDSFSQMIALGAGNAYRVRDGDEALQKLGDILSDSDVSSAVISGDAFIASLGVRDFLDKRGIEVKATGIDVEKHKEASFSVDVGITGADYALADTGTLVICHGRENARLLSLAPPMHIAIVQIESLLPDIDTLVAEIKPGENDMPSAISLITGPSMTADIALQVTYGMHGPKSVHVIFVG
jgi:L-lactate dehydrogenase complex protein LldG